MIWAFFCTLSISFTFPYFCLCSCVLFALQLTSIHSFGKKTKNLTVFHRCGLNILFSHFSSSILKYTSHYLAFLFLTFLLFMALVLGLCQNISCGGDQICVFHLLIFCPGFQLTMTQLHERYHPICRISLDISLVRHGTLLCETIFMAMKMNLTMNTNRLCESDTGQEVVQLHLLLHHLHLFCLSSGGFTCLPKASGLDILTRGCIKIL